MTALALDTATRRACACLWARGGAVATWEGDEEPRAAQTALAGVDALLARASLRAQDLTAVAVGTGPGSYTGLRIGLATAQALGLALDVPVAGVSTLSALRHAAGADALVAIDGGRGEVFAEAEGFAPAAIRPDALPPALIAGALVVGDGAIRHRAAFAALGARVPDDADPRHRVQAASIAALAEQAGWQGDLAPRYLRQPDAEAAA